MNQLKNKKDISKIIKNIEWETTSDSFKIALLSKMKTVHYESKLNDTPIISRFWLYSFLGVQLVLLAIVATINSTFRISNLMKSIDFPQVNWPDFSFDLFTLPSLPVVHLSSTAIICIGIVFIFVFSEIYLFYRYATKN